MAVLKLMFVLHAYICFAIKLFKIWHALRKVIIWHISAVLCLQNGCLRHCLAEVSTGSVGTGRMLAVSG